MRRWLLAQPFEMAQPAEMAFAQPYGYDSACGDSSSLRIALLDGDRPACGDSSACGDGSLPSPMEMGQTHKAAPVAVPDGLS